MMSSRTGSARCKLVAAVINGTLDMTLWFSAEKNENTKIVMAENENSQNHQNSIFGTENENKFL